MTEFVSLFGDTLKGQEGDVPTETALAGKVVGLYFSAHWCPPCRGFTPALANIYRGLIAAGKNFEIVFVSSDRDEASFNEYFSEMPWMAVPFSERQKKDVLSSKFKVRGIPTLVLIDEQGRLITSDGRATVTEDPTGRNFPWLPKPVPELLGETLKGKDGDVPLSSLKGKNIAIYFSAHWCPPCRQFTPFLGNLYKSMKAAKQNMEFIFVSSDRDEGQFNEYYSEMPWLAMKFERRAEKEELSRRFDVSGIPTLITLDENFNLINKSARGPASADPKGLHFPWPPQPVEDLAATVENNGFDVNEKPSLIALMAGMKDTVAAEAALNEIAREYVAKGKESGDGPDVLFFTAKTATGAVPQVLRMMGLAADFAPALILLDIPDNGGFYTAKPDKIDADSIRQFLADYHANPKQVDRRQLRT